VSRATAAFRWARRELPRSYPWLLAHSCIGHARRLRGFVRRRWIGDDPCRASSDHAVYAHYDPEGMIHDYVVEQVRQLAGAGFRVTFVTNARRLRETSVALVRPYCREIIWRRNHGLDFGAYKDGLRAVGALTQALASCERLVLMNDSVYGPFFPLREVTDKAPTEACDFWGITDSWERHFHVQTYFIMFFKSAIASPAFARFWRRLPYVNSKSWVIRHGEVRLSQQLTRHRLSARVLCPYWDVARSVCEKLSRAGNAPAVASDPRRSYADELKSNLVFGRALNGTHYFWDTLIADFRAPFIKRDLILKNPQRIPDAWRWAELISRHYPCDLEAIHRHLQAR